MDMETRQPEQNTGGEKSEAKKINVVKEIRDWLIAIGVAILVALFLLNVVIVNAQVPTESMEPTIMTNDRVLGFRLSYTFTDPQRLDVVIFDYPDDGSQLFVKRIIGMPGDVVEIRDGLVYLNGGDIPLDEPYVNGVPYGDYGPFTVPSDSYFVMGDNRNNSHDSRYWQNTYVPASGIVGKAVFRLWPNPGTLG